jgi:hypothetical protein
MCADEPGSSALNGPAACGSTEPPLMGRCMIRTDTDTSTNSAIRAPVTMAGSTLPAGCSRMTAVAFLYAARVLSRPSASMSCGSGSAGP